MRPVLAVQLKPGIDVDAEYVSDICNRALDREFGRAGGEPVSVRVLNSEEELRQFQAGELVLYRKPARRVGNVITYQKDGVTHRLEQLTLDVEEADPNARP